MPQISKEALRELLGVFLTGDEKEALNKTEPTEEELEAERGAEAREEAQSKAEEAHNKSQEAISKAQEELNKKTEKDGVVESNEKLTPIEKRLLEKEIESGLRESGLEWNSATEFLEKFVNFDHFRSEDAEIGFDQDKIEEFVSAISSVATGAPPQSKKKPAGKPGFGRYLDKED